MNAFMQIQTRTNRRHSGVARARTKPCHTSAREEAAAALAGAFGSSRAVSTLSTD